MEETEGGRAVSGFRPVLIPRRQSLNEASVMVEESLEEETGAPLTTRSEQPVSRYQLLLHDEDDSTTVRPWTVSIWHCVCPVALLLLLLFLIVSGTVWAAKQIAAQIQKATDVTLFTSLTRSVISIEITPTDPGLDDTSTSGVVTAETTIATTTEKTTSIPTTTKATTSTTTTPTTTKTSATTTPTPTTVITTTPPMTSMLTTSETTAEASTTTAVIDSEKAATARPLIGDCFGRGRTFTFCEKAKPGAYRDAAKNRCYDVKDENLYLCNDGANRFASTEECQEQCLRREPPLRECSVVPDLVPCRGKHLKRTWWFYDRRRCTEWAHDEGKCPDIEGRIPQYSTESECMAECNKDEPSQGCYSTGSNKPCPVSVMQAPYFAFRPEYGSAECYLADIETMRKHRCIDEYRRFSDLDLCFEECVVRREIQALAPLFQPLWDTSNGSETTTGVTKAASELLTH